MTKVKALEAVLKRDRLVMVMALGVLTIIAALYTVFGVGMRMSAIEMTAMADEPMTGMGAMAMQPAEWSLAYFGLVFLMWWVMMVAMMLPSAAPMILLYAAVKRKSEPEIEIRSLMSLFLVGYLLIWAGFSLGAAGLQWVLELRGLVSATMMTATSGALGGAILLAAGLYQFTPIKQACLRHCRSPVHFLSKHWRPGPMGALRMGVAHGIYCLGCCWFLMALLFFGGIMNLYWIVGIAFFVLFEKFLPAGHWVARGAGAGLIIWGSAVVLGTI